MSLVVGHTKRIVDLSSSERATMFGLLSLKFFGVKREDFIRDLEEKDVVMLLRKESLTGEIVGFSTLMILELSITGRRVKAIFSGDTTVLEQYRTSSGLGIELCRYFMNALKAFPDFEMYYILISKGWRTYKVLPFLFKCFAPCCGEEITPCVQGVMDAFCALKYPLEYNSSRGLIVFPRETQRVMPGSIDAVPLTETDTHIQFFLSKNPTYLSGTELVCVALVDETNFAPGMMRLLKTLTK